MEENTKPKENSEAGEVKAVKAVDLDGILVREVGQFGWYQARAVALSVVAVIFAAWASVEYVFTTARIRTRCLIPECESYEQAEFLPSWLLNAVPANDRTTFEYCSRFASLFANMSASDVIGDYCPAELFDRNNMIGCDYNVYENTNSVVYDLNLGCDEWLRSLIGSARTFGTLLALPLVGWVSDRWGRRTALAISAFNTAWIGVTRYWANTYIGFTISEVAEATFGSGIVSCMYILLIEIVGPRYRVVVGACVNSCFAVGQVLLGLLAWAVPQWRSLTLTLYIPQLITIAYFWLFSESVRWYISKGRYEDAENVLKEMARVNKRELSEASLKALRQNAEQEKRKNETNKDLKVNEPWLIKEVFKHKVILFRCAISPVWWITSTFIYYGLSINSVNLSGNSYVNYILVSAVELPGYWIAFFLINIVGRRPVLTTALWICSACQLAYVLLPDDIDSFALALFLVGKCSIAAVMTGIYVFTNELYPTKYRHSLFAFSSMMGRIGSILAPATPALGEAVWDKLPYALFCGLSLISGALVLLMPETLGQPLPNTMEDATNLGNKRINVTTEL